MLAPALMLTIGLDQRMRLRLPGSPRRVGLPGPQPGASGAGRGGAQRSRLDQIRLNSATQSGVWLSCPQPCCAWRKATWNRGWSDCLRLDQVQAVVLTVAQRSGASKMHPLRYVSGLLTLGSAFHVDVLLLAANRRCPQSAGVAGCAEPLIGFGRRVPVPARLGVDLHQPCPGPLAPPGHSG